MLYEFNVVLLVGIGLFLSGVVKGSTGLGYASCALPFLVYAVGLKDAISMVLIPAMATNLAVAIGNGFLVETCRRFAALYVAMLPGIAIGVGFLLWADPKVAVAILGTCIIAYAAFALMQPKLDLPSALVAPLQIPVGLTQGILTGFTGSQVVPLVPYVLATSLDPAKTVQAINLGVMLASAVLLAGLSVTGVITQWVLVLSLAAVLPALAGAEIGRRMQQYISDAVFKKAILVVLLFSGLGMLVR